MTVPFRVLRREFLVILCPTCVTYLCISTRREYITFSINLSRDSILWNPYANFLTVWCKYLHTGNFIFIIVWFLVEINEIAHFPSSNADCILLKAPILSLVIFWFDKECFYFCTKSYEVFCVCKRKQNLSGNALFSNLPNKNILGIFSVKLRNWEKVNKFSVSRTHVLSRVGLEPVLPFLVVSDQFGRFSLSRSASGRQFFFGLLRPF